ncbi:hypothetical protein EV667_3475 [Ancylobacter aquaticus]|uniref:Uncharacterized protein n=1 Tax=Ancylobacter aquaticus TaxID=100 RepID=A0A4V2PI85_ANCAQ|nr:hypothetical protein [Ancylobacter aquaticus]TCK23636.1 hypothetical protein EV667_3475 [Ancylobacter aquaticus]
MSFEMSETVNPTEFVDALAGAAYEPEDVALLDTVFARACGQVSERLVIGEGIRSLLAFAILEGAKSGLRDPEHLTSFALRALPSFRAQERQR